ncbi:hypothetical protein HGRIS_010532 [Hohenbuehelia grisea]|uniref:Uncharacterized protein n=1 Tax=Hohenbuehelia grisea TaxID=104357 RepID=A0ABR3IXC7_9AGAR
MALPCTTSNPTALCTVKRLATPNSSFVGLAGTEHQRAAKEAGVNIAEWFADLDYSPEGKLIITQKHDPIPHDVITKRVKNLLENGQVTTIDGTTIPLGVNVAEVSICCHSDTPGAVENAQLVKRLVDESNARAGYTDV